MLEDQQPPQQSFRDLGFSPTKILTTSPILSERRG